MTTVRGFPFIRNSSRISAGVKPTYVQTLRAFWKQSLIGTKFLSLQIKGNLGFNSDIL